MRAVAVRLQGDRVGGIGLPLASSGAAQKLDRCVLFV